MKLEKKHFKTNCHSCKCETNLAFSLDKKNWFCGNCTAALISDNYIVADKHFDPDDFPDIFFPNWYHKEYFEETYGKNLTDERWQKLKYELQYSEIMDNVSEIVYELLPNEI